MNDSVSHTPTHGGVYRVDDEGAINKEVDHFGQKVEAADADKTDAPSWHPNHKAKKSAAKR